MIFGCDIKVIVGNVFKKIEKKKFVLANPLIVVEDINGEVEIPLRTAANKQSQGGGQGFVKCGCGKTC